MHWRYLHLCAFESRQNLTDHIRIDSHKRPLDDFAFGIPRARRESQPERCAISLLGIQHETREFGRFAKTYRQKPGRERIQRAGVSGFFGVEQAL